MNDLDVDGPSALRIWVLDRRAVNSKCLSGMGQFVHRGTLQVNVIVNDLDICMCKNSFESVALLLSIVEN